MLWCLSDHHCVLIKERVLRNLEAQHKEGIHENNHLGNKADITAYNCFATSAGK